MGTLLLTHWPTSVLGDVADPRQGLITALLNDLQVTHLWRENKVVLSQRRCAEFSKGQRTGRWRSSRYILCSTLLLLVFLKKDNNICAELNYLLSTSSSYISIDFPWLHICRLVLRHHFCFPTSRYLFLKLPVVFVFIFRVLLGCKGGNSSRIHENMFARVDFMMFWFGCSGLWDQDTYGGCFGAWHVGFLHRCCRVGCLFVGLLELVKPVYPASIKASMFENNHICSLVSEYIEKRQIVA